MWRGKTFHRLPVDTATLEGGLLRPDASNMRHVRALRLEDGEQVELFDGKGSERVFMWAGQSGVFLPLDEPVRHPRHPGSLTLFGCVTKGSRWDWTIEKAVELGVTRIVPVISGNTIVRIAKEDRAAKRERWERIALDAARQSHAVWMPEILAPVDFREADAMAQETKCFAGILAEPRPPMLLDAIAASGVKRDGDISLFVGPEGDFTSDEYEAVKRHAIPASFGESVLRAETAALFGLSVLAAWRR